MRISHEVSLDLLEESLKWNDYQYVLPHLMDKYPTYRERSEERRVGKE